MHRDLETTLSPTEAGDLRCLAGMLIPASTEFDVPGADDPVIFADVTATLGRDFDFVRQALATLAGLSGGAFADLNQLDREAVLATFHATGGAPLAALTRVLLQCYYRADRVVLSLGLEPRAPFPRGHVLEQGDWSLLDPVRSRAKMWREVPPR